MRRVAAVAFLVLCAAPAWAQGASGSDPIEALLLEGRFQGAQLGQPMAILPGLVRSGGTDEEPIYVRPGATPSIYGLKLDRVMYVERDGQLAAIGLYASESGDKLVSMLQQTLPAPAEVNREAKRIVWRTDFTIVTMALVGLRDDVVVEVKAGPALQPPSQAGPQAAAAVVRMRGDGTAEFSASQTTDNGLMDWAGDLWEQDRKDEEAAREAALRIVEAAARQKAAEEQADQIAKKTAEETRKVICGEGKASWVSGTNVATGLPASLCMNNGVAVSEICCQ